MIQSIHGNLLVIDSLGVLMTGERDIGKSELSLALIDRGHQLVSDDCVDLKTENKNLVGSCPALSNGYLLISGIGVIDIPKLFGHHAVVNKHAIHFCLELCRADQMPLAKHPLQPVTETITLHHIKLPKIFFPVTESKSLPLMIETLVRNFRLQLEGYDASETFNQRCNQALLSQTQKKHYAQKKIKYYQ